MTQASWWKCIIQVRIKAEHTSKPPAQPAGFKELMLDSALPRWSFLLVPGAGGGGWALTTPQVPLVRISLRTRGFGSGSGPTCGSWLCTNVNSRTRASSSPPWLPRLEMGSEGCQGCSVQAGKPSPDLQAVWLRGRFGSQMHQD